MMELSVSSYSFSQYISAGKLTQLSLVKKAHEMGFSLLDFTEIIPEEGFTAEEYAAKIREEADKYGIKIACYAVGANMSMETAEEDDREFERIKKQLDIAKILGAPTFRHDASFKLASRFKTFGQALPSMAKNIRRIAEYAETLSIKTMIENHGFICQDSLRVEAIVTEVNHPNFGLLLDIGNFMCVDENPAIAVSRCAPYAFHVHAKDFYFVPYNGEKKDWLMTRGGNYLKGSIIGDGVVPVKQCLQILKSVGYDGSLGIEFEGSEDCIEAIGKGRSTLEKYIGELF